MQKETRKLRSIMGMALVELMVSLAMLVIVSIMIVSFSAVAKHHVQQQQSQYAFLEEASEIKSALSDWLSQMDAEGTVCTVTEDDLSVSATGAATFKRNALMLIHNDGTVTRLETEAVTDVQFAIIPVSGGNAVVKCFVTGGHDRNEPYEQSFLLTLRCGSFAE